MYTLLRALCLLVLLVSPSWAKEEFSEITTLQNAATATGNGTVLSTDGYNAVVVALTATDGTVTWETGGATSDWIAIPCFKVGSNASSTTASATGLYICNVAGMNGFRARISTYGSGSVTVTAQRTTAYAGASSGFLFDANGYLKTAQQYLYGGEHVDAVEDNGYMRTVGGLVRSTTAMTGVTTNTTSVAFTTPSGGKTPIAQVSGTGAVTATVKLYGDNDNTAANGILLCTSTMSGTTKVVQGCDSTAQFTTDYPYYYATTENVTGTGATVEFIVATGIAGSGAGAAGGGDASAANQTTMITALQLIDNIVGVEDAAETAAGGLAMAGSVRRDVPASSAGATGDNATVNTNALGAMWVSTIDPCSAVAKTHIPISISTATTTELTPSLAGASTHYYVCSLDLSATGGANNVALVDDDSDECGSVTSGLAGGTSASTGWGFPAGGGIVKGNGNATVYKTGGTNRVLCLVTSAAVQLSGSIQVVAAP